jgi:hypothetical protein
VADVSVTLNTVTAFASDDGLTTPPLRTATVAGGSVTVTSVGGVLPPITLPLTIDPSPNADLLTAIVSSLSGNPLLTGVVQALTSDLSGIVNLETNFQPPPVSGTFSVTGLHVGVLGASAGDLDVARPRSAPTPRRRPSQRTGSTSRPARATAAPWSPSPAPDSPAPLQ